VEVELLAGVEPVDASEPDEPDESDPELDPFASEPDEGEVDEAGVDDPERLSVL
jgi:hypothetical protein